MTEEYETTIQELIPPRGRFISYKYPKKFITSNDYKIYWAHDKQDEPYFDNENTTLTFFYQDGNNIIIQIPEPATITENNNISTYVKINDSDKDKIKEKTVNVKIKTKSNIQSYSDLNCITNNLNIYVKEDNGTYSFHIEPDFIYEKVKPEDTLVGTNTYYKYNEEKKTYTELAIRHEKKRIDLPMESGPDPHAIIDNYYKGNSSNEILNEEELNEEELNNIYKKKYLSQDTDGGGGARRKSSRKNPKKKTRRNRRKSVRRNRRR